MSGDLHGSYFVIGTDLSTCVVCIHRVGRRANSSRQHANNVSDGELTSSTVSPSPNLEYGDWGTAVSVYRHASTFYVWELVGHPFRDL